MCANLQWYKTIYWLSQGVGFKEGGMDSFGDDRYIHYHNCGYSFKIWNLSNVQFKYVVYCKLYLN